MMAFHKSQKKLQHNMQYNNFKYCCDWPLFFLYFLPSFSKNLLIISNHSVTVQMLKIWSRHVTAICSHQSNVHRVEALFFWVSVLLSDKNRNKGGRNIFPII